MKVVTKKEDNLVLQLWNKFVPFWPLFLVLIVIFLAGAWAYLQYKAPLYQATASILIKDEKKGSDDSKLSESLNYLSSKKIVENEIEVLKSNSLLKEVVLNLNLYAAVYEEGKFKPTLLYENAPVTIIHKDADTLRTDQKVYFSIQRSTGKVVINDKVYPYDEWVNTRIGMVMFIAKSGYVPSDKPLFFTLTNPKVMVNALGSMLNVSSVSKLSSVIGLSIMDQSSVRAEDILREILTGYNKILSDEKNTLAKNISSSVEDRLNYVKQDLDSIERKIQQFKANGALDISSQGKLFLENVSTNDQKLSEINMQMAVLNQVGNYIQSKNNVGGIVPSTLGVSDPMLSQLLNKLYDAELQYEKLKKTTAENNPVLVAVTDEIKKIKPGILENIESQRRSLSVSKNNLYATNGAYSSIMQAIPQKERDLVEISREHSIKSNIYNILLQRREEAALSYSSNTLNNKVVDEPESSQGPVSPNKKLIYLASIVFAMAVGVSLIVGKELLSSKILYRNEIEQLTTFPVIGEIAYEKSNNPLAIADGKRGLVAEQFRKLRASIYHMGMVENKKKILITSTISGEGKSFVAANLGLTLALAGKKVILLEFDLSNPALSEKLDVNEEKGISSYLQGESEAEEIIKPTDASRNLFIIPCGDLPDNPSELIMNGKVQELFAYLEGKFDHIIVDSAPVGALSDAYILSPLCDSTLYIVRHNYTPKAGLQRLEGENNIELLKNVTIVFNGVQPRGFSKSDYGYGYGYTKGYLNQPKPRKTKLLDNKTV